MGPRLVLLRRVPQPPQSVLGQLHGDVCVVGTRILSERRNKLGDGGQLFGRQLADFFFNLFEGVCWCLFGLLVAIRFLRFRRGWMELAYAAAFVTFGLTDFREASSLQTWLIWAKGVNLLVLFLLRREVMRRFYPESRLF